jgi:hypothetical protein
MGELFNDKGEAEKAKLYLDKANELTSINDKTTK